MAATRKTTDEVVIEKKKYSDNDLIPCRSLITGGLYADGYYSKMFYTWADYEDVQDVEYKDLIYWIRRNDIMVFGPRIIIEDEDIVNQYPKLKNLYDSLYSVADLREIINLPPKQMADEINKLPSTVKNSIRGLVSTMIEDGSLDSVKKIKAIDDIFGTQLLLTLVDR